MFSVFAFLDNYKMILAITGLWGAGVGMSMALHSLVVIQYMGLDLFSKVFGATGLIIAFIFISVGPLVGENDDVFFLFTHFSFSFSLVMSIITKLDIKIGVLRA